MRNVPRACSQRSRGENATAAAAPSRVFGDGTAPAATDEDVLGRLRGSPGEDAEAGGAAGVDPGEGAAEREAAARGGGSAEAAARAAEAADRRGVGRRPSEAVHVDGGAAGDQPAIAGEDPRAGGGACGAAGAHAGGEREDCAAGEGGGVDQRAAEGAGSADGDDHQAARHVPRAAVAEGRGGGERRNAVRAAVDAFGAEAADGGNTEEAELAVGTLRSDVLRAPAVREERGRAAESHDGAAACGEAVRRAERRNGAPLAGFARHDAAANPQARARKHLAAEHAGWKAEGSRPRTVESAVERAV